MIEVRFQRGLHLPELDLWLDPQDAKPWAFVSHAHADHFARHESALCSDVTAALVHKRFHLAENRIQAVSFDVPVVRDGFRLRLLPAGHISGSAMLHVTRIKDNASLLYTGDFKTRRGRTAEAVNFLAADTLIMETTFGLPNFEFPAQMEIEASILRFVQGAFADGETPVLFGYSLGKAQEALALLTEHGIPALLHPTVAAMTVACRAAGFEMLPEPVEFEGHAPAGHVIIAPPNTIRSKLLRGLKSKRTAMLTGWALQPGAKFRYRVDEVFPLSDHADHPGLLECIKRVRPQKILTVHGSTKEFAAELRTRGMDAWCAMGGDQLELSIHQAAQRSGPAGGPRHSRAICALADFGDLCRLVGETALLARHGKLAEATLRPLVPVKCMLAAPLERDPEDDRPLFEKLPFAPPFWLEPKYDGIRAQLHKHGDDVALFSRDLRPLDEESPELLASARKLTGSFILDGELIAFSEGRKLGFADLQKRLGRRMADGDLFLTDDEIDSSWPTLFLKLLDKHSVSDSAHDPGHISRVVTNARRLTVAEGADWSVVMPAAWLHDCVIVPKSSPDRKQASILAARQAIAWLEENHWPHGRLDEIAHAIEAHSFSAGIAPRTLEAMVVQDADRLDALGAVGLARTLMLGGELRREFYAVADPFCDSRPPDDSVYTLDHLYSKLLTLESTMQTTGGKAEARLRTVFLRGFLNQLRDEVGLEG